MHGGSSIGGGLREADWNIIASFRSNGTRLLVRQGDGIKGRQYVQDQGDRR
jgi:hypothetical protein